MPGSSAESAICRLDWRPSRIVTRGLPVLGFIAAAALWLTALPAAVAAAGSCLVLVAVWRQTMRESRLPPLSLRLDTVTGHLGPEGASVAGWRVQVRGPCLMVQGRDADGQRHRRLFWPGQLDAAQWRHLRLARTRTTSAAASPGWETVAP